MNIAFVNNLYRLGGAETIVRQLHEACGERGIASSLFIAEGKTFPKDDSVVPLYPRYLSYLHYSRFRDLVETLFPRRSWTDRAFRALKHSSFDVIHVHSFHEQYASMESLSEVAHAKPTLWTLHGIWSVTGGCDQMLVGCHKFMESCGDCPQLGIWPIGTIDNTAEKLAEKKSTLAKAPLTVVTPSRWLRDTVLASPVGSKWDVRQIPNGVNTEIFCGARKRTPELRAQFGIDSGSTVILAVNRNFTDPAKGGPMMKEALDMVARANLQNVTVLLAGQNSEPFKSTLHPGIQAISQGYVSSQQELAALYEVADIFLFASPSEVFPTVVLEAMAAECCVVTTPTSGAIEQVQPDVSGFIADAIDGASLGKALLRATREPALVRNLGVAARQRVLERYTEREMIEAYLSLYEELKQRNKFS